jgi:ATP-binding cassette, subfamily B, bacterial
MWTELRWIISLTRQVWNSLTRVNRLGLMSAMLLMPIAGFLTNVPAVLLGRLVDKMLHGGSRDVMAAAPFVGWIAVALLFREALTILRKYLVENTGTRVYKSKTVQVMTHLLRLDLHAFGPEQRVGGVQGRMQRSLEGFVKLIKLSFLDLLPAVVTAICALAVVALRNPALMALMAAVIPIGLTIALLQIKAQKGIRIDLLRAKEEIDGRVVELLGGIEYIRAADTESIEVRKVGLASEKLRLREIQHHVWMSVYDAFKALNEGFFHILVLFTTIYLAYNGRASAGDVLAFSVLFTAVVNPLREVHRILDEAHESGLRATDLFELLKKPEDASYLVCHSAGRRRDEEEHPHLELKDVVYRYPGGGVGPGALSHVSLQIRVGETVGVVGPSGSGKSTLIKSLLRLLHPDSGAIYVDGRRLDEMSRAEIAQEFGYVSQTPFLFAGTIEENIAYGCGPATHEDIVVAAKQAQIHDEILRMPGQYAAVVSERGANLSGGQRQRIAIARVLLKNPRIFILDEATSALDNLNEKAVQAALAQAMIGRTMIIVAHRLSTLVGADRILVFQNGRIVEAGTFDELLEQGGAFAELNHAGGVRTSGQSHAALAYS